MNARTIARQREISGTNRGSVLQRKCACGQHTGAGGECTACRKKRMQLQRKAAYTVEPANVPPIVHEVLRSPGRPLDPTTRAFMEPRFGRNFSQVRVHTNTQAAKSAQAVNAYAYTVGRSVVFGRNQYAPGTTEGRKLLAHELIHTVQQQSGRSQATPQQLAISESAMHEKEASILAEQVVGQEKLGPSDSTADSSNLGFAASVSPLPAGITPLQRNERPPSRSVGSLRRLEETYRWGARQFADPELREAALNVATCIEQEGRGAFCETLVTDDDLWQMYGEYSLIEDVFGTERADAALRDHQLSSVAAEAAAQSGSSTSVAGAAVAGAAPALPQAPVGPSPTAPTRPPLRVIPGGRGPLTPPTAPRNPPLRVVPGGGTGTAPRTAPRIPPGAVGPAIVVVVGVTVIVQLSEFASFQRKAFNAGYRYLPSGRGVCMRGCHSPRAPQPSRPFEFPPLLPEPSTPSEIDLLRDWLRQTPPISDLQEEPGERTAPIPEPRPERRRRREEACFLTEAFPLGGNPEHDALAAFVTGQPVEYILSTEDGLFSARYDGKDAADTLYEIKTRHDFLQLLDQPEARLGPRGRRAIAEGVPDVIGQIEHQAMVAAICGYEFRVATNNLRIVDILRELAPGITVEYVEFRWP